MDNKKIRVSLRTDIKNKANEYQNTKLANGWTDSEITIAEFIQHIEKGHPFAHRFSGGRKDSSHFISADVLVADIDKNYTLNEACNNDFVRKYASFIYTTPNHTEQAHRFRIVFTLNRRIFDADSYFCAEDALSDYVPLDPSTKSCAQCFYGNEGAHIIRFNESIPDDVITSLVNKGKSKKYQPLNTKHTASISGDKLVITKSRVSASINSLSKGRTIFCPFGNHTDKHPSAFIVVSNDGVKGVHCRTCNKTEWTETIPTRNQFNTFDELVLNNKGKENSHFTYQGLSVIDHGFETNMGKSNYHVYETKHIKFTGIIPGIHLVKSPKGTGKTHALAELTTLFKNPTFRKENEISKDGRVILIGHRQSLIKESAEKLGLECYLDTGDYDFKREYLPSSRHTHGYGKSLKPMHYAICLDSLSSRINLGNEQYDVIIIDESEQVFSHLLSKHMKRPTDNFSTLSSLIKSAKYVFCLDADLDKVTITGVLSCLQNTSNNQSLGNKFTFEKLFCHLNTYKPPTKNIEVFSGKHHLLDELRASIGRGERCYVTSNSKKDVKGWYASFSGAFPTKKFKLITSDEGDDPDVREFLRNIKTDILTFDAVFCSPTIGTGIDITFPNNEQLIDNVFGFFDNKINTHFDADQQLSRVRNPKRTRVWLNPTNYKLTTDIATIHQELLGGNEVSGLRFFLNNEGVHANKTQHPFMDLLAEIVVSRRRSQNNFKQNFIDLKKKNGWKVVPIVVDDSKSSKGSVVAKASTKARKNECQDALMKAKEMTFKEFHLLAEEKKKNRAISTENKVRLERYRIENFYHQPISIELIEYDDDGKTQEKIKLLEWVINPDINITNFQQSTDYTHIALNWNKDFPKEADLKRTVFMREMLEQTGLFSMKGFKFIPNADYCNESLLNFRSFIKNYRERYLQLFDKTVNEHIDERTPFQVNAILKLIGLKHIMVNKNRGSNSGSSTYKIDLEAYNKTLSILEARKKDRGQ